VADPLQVASRIIGPPVKRTGERLGIAEVHPADTQPAMPARIEQRFYRAIALPHYQDPITTYVGAKEVAVIFYLLLVRQEIPGAEKELLSLLSVDFFVSENAASDQPMLPIHHLRQRLDFVRTHNSAPSNSEKYAEVF
jgi:hypothetical protein